MKIMEIIRIRPWGLVTRGEGRYNFLINGTGEIGRKEWRGHKCASGLAHLGKRNPRARGSWCSVVVCAVGGIVEFGRRRASAWVRIEGGERKDGTSTQRQAETGSVLM